MFIETIFLKIRKKLNELEIMYQNIFYIYILDIAKFADLLRKTVNVSRNQGVCHVIQISFKSPLVNIVC